MTEFAEQLKNLELKNMSQEALAKELFVSRQSISKYENGEAKPDFDNLIKLSKLLEVSLDELIFGEEK